MKVRNLSATCPPFPGNLIKNMSHIMIVVTFCFLDKNDSYLSDCHHSLAWKKKVSLKSIQNRSLYRQKESETKVLAKAKVILG